MPCCESASRQATDNSILQDIRCVATSMVERCLPDLSPARAQCVSLALCLLFNGKQAWREII